MNLLLTSVGRRSYLVKYFKEALDGNGQVHVSNSSGLSPAFPYADHSVVTPLAYSDSYIPFLLEYCQKNNIDAILSLLDLDLPVLAAHREQFAAVGTRLLISDSKVIEICNDKWLSYQFLRENEFQTPTTWISLEAFHNDGGHFPVLIKPRWGMGSLSIFEAENEMELTVLFHKAKKATLCSPMLRYEAGQDMERCVVIQEKLNGQEYGLDIINDLTGKYQTTIVKKKLAMRAGETDCAQVEDVPVLKRLGQKISSVLGHIANLDADVFMADGKPYVLEMNARFGGGYPFSHLAGVDLPRAIVAWMDGKNVHPGILEAKINIIGHKDIVIQNITNFPQ